MLFDHTSLNITFPVLTFIFFDTQTHLFTPDVSSATRSMWYGLCIAIPHVVNMVMTPILSALSDMLGRKKLLLFSIAGAFVFAIIAGSGVCLGMISLLLLGRIIQGAFSRTNPIAQAVIADISNTQDKVRNMGYLQVAISLGAFIGPLLGGYFANRYFFQTLNYSLPYWIAAGFAAISFLLTCIYFKETLTTFPTAQKISQLNWPLLKKLFCSRDILWVSLVLMFSQVSWSLYYQFMPPLLKMLFHFDTHALGIFVGLIALWLALASAFAIKFLQRYCSLQQMLSVSLYLILLGLLVTIAAILLANKANACIWFAAIPTAVGDVIAYSCLVTLYSDRVPQAHQGKVMGICFVIVGLIWSSTAILGGMLLSLNPLWPVLISPIGMMICIVLMHQKSLFIKD